jgi:hypothetical protein
VVFVSTRKTKSNKEKQEGTIRALGDLFVAAVRWTCNEANPDLDMAWKMLDIARMILAKSPEKTIEKFNTFYALAEVYMKRGSSVLLVTTMLGQVNGRS